MNCMKCGRETVHNQVFCNECLADMENYPVKPGTLIQLPRRREEVPVKKSHSRRKVLPPEEQVKVMKKQIRRLRINLLILAILLAVAGYFTAVHLMESEISFLPGQNYSSVTSVEETLPE